MLPARRPDMAGAKIGSDGEWTHAAAEERGMEIIGDVVAQCEPPRHPAQTAAVAQSAEVSSAMRSASPPTRRAFAFLGAFHTSGGMTAASYDVDGCCDLTIRVDATGSAG